MLKIENSCSRQSQACLHVTAGKGKWKFIYYHEKVLVLTNSAGHH